MCARQECQKSSFSPWRALIAFFAVDDKHHQWTAGLTSELSAEGPRLLMTEPCEVEAPDLIRCAEVLGNAALDRVG